MPLITYINKKYNILALNTR